MQTEDLVAVKVGKVGIVGSCAQAYLGGIRVNGMLGDLFGLIPTTLPSHSPSRTAMERLVALASCKLHAQTEIISRTVVSAEHRDYRSTKSSVESIHQRNKY